MPQRNQCCSGFYNPFPLNIGSLMSAPTTIFVAGRVRTKFGLVRLPYPLFTVLLLLVFTKSLGDRSRNLTSGTVGELYTRCCFGASVDSSYSLSPSDINRYSSSSSQDPLYDASSCPSSSQYVLQLPLPNSFFLCLLDLNLLSLLKNYSSSSTPLSPGNISL